MNFANLILEKKAATAYVTVNRPKVLNALNVATVTELGQVFSEIQKDESTRTVILTGAGEKAFVAGADISELADLDEASGKEFARSGQAVFDQIENLGKPVIACVNGFALGGGCELAMACTMRLASENAKFGQPEVKLGIIPGYGGTQRLPRLVGKGMALQLLLTGEIITAQEALRIGPGERSYLFSRLDFSGRSDRTKNSCQWTRCCAACAGSGESWTGHDSGGGPANRGRLVCHLLHHG